jgi:nucleoside-diphosphate kinase
LFWWHTPYFLVTQLNADQDLLKKHYADLTEKPFFNDLVEFMSSSPVVAMCWEGDGVVAEGDGEFV